MAIKRILCAVRDVFCVKKNKKLFAIIGVCVVIVAAVVGVFVVKDHRDNAQAPVTEFSAIVTEAQATEVTETEVAQTEPPVTLPVVTATQEQLDKVVYSAQVGEVNGTTYAVINVGTEKFDGNYIKASANPVLYRLPVSTEGYITAFASYEDYVYYVVTENYMWGETYSLYRCNKDFSGQELLLQNDMQSEEGYVDIGWHFIIDNGKLYGTDYRVSGADIKYQCVDLETKEITYETRVDYSGLKGVQPEESVVIYDGKVFCYDGDYFDHSGTVIAYQLVDGERKPLKDETISGTVARVSFCGYGEGCIYYYEGGPFVDGANNFLKRYNLSDGTVELLDKRSIGGENYFFQEYAVQ